MSDPFGFEAAINWDAVDEHAEEISAMFEKSEAQPADMFSEGWAEVAEDEQSHWEEDPAYMALYCPPAPEEER